MIRSFALSVLALTACAEPYVTTSMGGDFSSADIELNGGGWAWWLTDDGTEEAVDPARLQLRFTGATNIDPVLDYRYVSSAIRTEAAADWARAPRLTLDIRAFLDGKQLEANQEYTKVHIDPDPTLHVGRSSGLTPGAELPGNENMVGSRHEYVLQLSNVSMEAGDVLTGKFNWKVQRKDDGTDPAGVMTGEMAFNFSVPLVSERVAHCNEVTHFGVDYDHFRDWPCEGLE